MKHILESPSHIIQRSWATNSSSNAWLDFRTVKQAGRYRVEQCEFYTKIEKTHSKFRICMKIVTELPVLNLRKHPGDFENILMKSIFGFYTNKEWRKLHLKVVTDKKQRKTFGNMNEDRLLNSDLISGRRIENRWWRVVTGEPANLQLAQRSL